MNVLYRELAERIRDEMEDMEHIVQRALRAWPKAKEASEEQYVYLDSVALNLHSFYSGIERLFELIARHVDGRRLPVKPGIVTCFNKWLRI